MTTKKFQNADDLVQYCIANNQLVGQVWVDSNPFGQGERTLLFFDLSLGYLNTDLGNQSRVEGIDYAFNWYWHTDYKGTFDLILPEKKGFNPSTLEFDGVPIKAGDGVEIRGYDGKYPVAINEDTGDLVVVFERVFVLLESLNITKHYPATPKDEEFLEMNIN